MRVKASDLIVEVSYRGEKWEIPYEKLQDFIKSKTNITVDKDCMQKIKDGWQCGFNNYQCKIK